MTDGPALGDLAPDQRPRERLATHGARALTDAELVALVLGSGLPGTNVVDLATRLLVAHGGLAGLARADATTLAREPGLGPAMASRLVAALALSSRAHEAEDTRPLVASSGDVARVTAPQLAGARRERVVLVVCGPRHRVLDVVVVADGTAHGAAFPVREVLAEVLRRDGVAFALAHNHPSGDPTPSGADLATTATLQDAAQRVGLRLLDHVVVAGTQWRSVTASA
ncbi:JAB domain-containing protein [Cellulomonas sp. CW35]|uniref:JAB domain-containing protein n=1 Tax=Cellulomonas sp. CW35 TaxID=3458249 RepID=UPI004033BEE1